VAKSCTVQASQLVLSLLPLLVAFAVPAVGQEAPTTAPRTVSWYADNPQARARVQLACLDDPGRLGNNPDCINAHQASVEVALRNARARTGTLDPRNPAFWSNDPETRRSKLIMCRRNPELANCDAAKRSLMVEAGVAQR
jgi:hypothetical protein